PFNAASDLSPSFPDNSHPEIVSESLSPESVITLTFEERIERIRKAAEAASTKANVQDNSLKVVDGLPSKPIQQVHDGISAPVYVSLPTTLQKTEIDNTQPPGEHGEAKERLASVAFTGGAMVTKPAALHQNITHGQMPDLVKTNNAAYISLPAEYSGSDVNLQEVAADVDKGDTLSFEQRIEKVRALSLATGTKASASKAAAAQKVRNPNLLELTRKTHAETSKATTGRSLPKQFANKKTVLIGLSALVLLAVLIGGLRYSRDNSTNATRNETRVQTESDQGAVAVRQASPVTEEEAIASTLPSVVPTQSEEKAVEKTEIALPVSPAPITKTEPRTPLVAPDKAVEKIELRSDEPLQKPEVKPALAVSNPDLTEQIYLKSNFATNENDAGVFDLNVSLQNKSDKILKTVAVNVFYNDKDGKVLNRQTLYFTDIKPGEVVSKAGSPHKLATKAHCELGLVSSEGSLYYSN
ncbi:MAG: hypothetical protein WKF70_14915, partial [Chitinophagaceae bacterium]